MINFKEMVTKAKAAGVTTEKAMWESIMAFSDLLEELKVIHPDLYWEVLRKQVGIMYHNHYDEAFAIYDVSKLCYSDPKGEKHYGAHWTVDQVEQATSSMHFPQGTNKWDKYVAFNVAYSDLQKDFDDEDILKAGFSLYFDDEDWGSNTKIWEYMSRPKKS